MKDGLTALTIASAGAGLGGGAGVDALSETQCFVAGTPVEMGDGTTKPIQDVKPGDIVKSRDPETGRAANEPILQTYMHLAEHVITIQLADGETFTCTPEHRIFVQNKGLEEAASLVAGDKLFRRASQAGGTLTPAVCTVVVSGISWHDQFGTILALTNVYNLDVAGTHSYFVGKVDGGVWVHNDCLCANFANTLTRTRHFADHGSDFGATTEDEYVSQASDFMTGDKTVILSKALDQTETQFGITRTRTSLAYSPEMGIYVPITDPIHPSMG